MSIYSIFHLFSFLKVIIIYGLYIFIEKLLQLQVNHLMINCDFDSSYNMKLLNIITDFLSLIVIYRNL